jgi:hypothetical protein
LGQADWTCRSGLGHHKIPLCGPKPEVASRGRAAALDLDISVSQMIKGGAYYAPPRLLFLFRFYSLQEHASPSEAKVINSISPGRQV